MEGNIANERALLLLPGTYMNESGRAVAEAVHFYKLEPANVAVFHDEVDLPPVKVRVKVGGSDAGHNGLRSISAHLGNDYKRVRIGIGRPIHGRGANIDFLLSAPRGDERIELDRAIERAADAALCWVSEGAEAAMNRYNA